MGPDGYLYAIASKCGLEQEPASGLDRVTAQRDLHRNVAKGALLDPSNQGLSVDVRLQLELPTRRLRRDDLIIDDDRPLGVNGLSLSKNLHPMSINPEPVALAGHAHIDMLL